MGPKNWEAIGLSTYGTIMLYFNMLTSSPSKK
jgi:hypothetical protein